MILYMGIVLYAPAIALEAVTGISKTNSILIIGNVAVIKYLLMPRKKLNSTYKFLIAFLGLVCTFYSTIGGMKAVLVTDVFQSLLMFAAIYSVIVCAAIHAGGIQPIWDRARQGGRLEFFKCV